MKSFFHFFREAAESQAAAQARKLGLKSDGHGGWINPQGKFVAKTEDGKLKFFGKRGKAQPEVAGTPKPRATPAAMPQTPQPKVAPLRKTDTKPEEEDSQAVDDTITVVFGRFNPPTAGHEKLLKTAEKMAVGGAFKIYPSRTQDPKKNPLDPDMKVSYMRKMFPDFEEEIINDPEMKTIFDVLVNASEEGHKNVNIVVGADRQSEFENLAQKYNGDLYDFDEIRVISAGVRDADAEGVEGVSASKLRKAVADDDLEAFKRGTPKDLDDGDVAALFNAVRQGMKLKKKAAIKSVKDETKIDTKVTEGYNLWEIAPRFDKKGLRNAYVKGNLYQLGDMVENLHTGLVGRVIRRGTNHLICVTQEEFMFKSWIRDVMEAVKPASKTGKWGVRAKDREVGTDAYLKYAQSMVPGQGKIRNFNIKEFINNHRLVRT